MLGRILFTFDDDLLVEAANYQRLGKSFAGLVYVHPMNISIGHIIHDLQMLGEIADQRDMQNHIEFLPL